MDNTSSPKLRLVDYAFEKFCLQNLAPLINFPLNSEDQAILKSQHKPCSCSRSGCTKLYCECFKKGKWCSGCNCINCLNSSQNSVFMKITIEDSIIQSAEIVRKKNLGCICKKNKCKQKYCGCARSGFACTEYCSCFNCENPGH